MKGERIEMENAVRKTEETLLELKRKDENNMSKNKVISIIYTMTMLVAVIVCCICDVAADGSFTWSLITLSAILFAWIISFPVIILGKKGILGGMLSLSIFIVPFLYLLGVLVNTASVFRIGAVMSICALVYMWAVYALCLRLRNRKMLAAGIAFSLAVPFVLIVNIALSKMIGEPVFDIWDMLSAFILLVLAFSFVIGDYAHRRCRI